jgi:predicted RNA-binding protein YlqC (UPF0109 family)
MADLQRLTEHIARSLVDDPDAVAVSLEQKGATAILKLSVARPDVGKIIGRQGRTAQAFRATLAIAAERDRKRAVMDIVE